MPVCPKCKNSGKPCQECGYGMSYLAEPRDFPYYRQVCPTCGQVQRRKYRSGAERTRAWRAARRARSMH